MPFLGSLAKPLEPFLTKNTPKFLFFLALSEAAFETILPLGLYFVLLRSKPKIPAFGTTGFGALLTGIFGLFFIDLDNIFIGNLVAISVSGLIILPFSFAALTYATRYTIAANISLLMLLETILGPVWVWFFLEETPGIQMVLGGIIVIFSLGIYFLKLHRNLN